MEQSIDEILHKSMDLLQTNLKTILSNITGDHTTIKNEFSALCAEYCKQDSLLQAQKEAFNRAASCTDIESIKEVYDTSYNEALSKVSTPEKHVKYIQFQEVLKTSASRSLDFTQESTALDPFTKKLIANPVKNKNCGHIYDRDSVMEILNIHSELRCPVVGCRVKTKFNVRNLMESSVSQEEEVMEL
ncbi:uncharacterized protein LOC113389403 [Ctenocephalides felis]|uniref:uncharacterized protein LOC113389403 n=1 Tax=Ctenocephalides felis TaxID=7515 RepID=UPI000E6E56B1|nr:uncharacterized protein LOC113389403 [Ctenocephalides felis]